jgi:SHS2 domain-containing protein
MGRVETFDHTADVGLRVFGSDWNDLFQTAAEGVLDYVVTNRAEVRPELEETIQIEAESASDLLVRWLNELIFRCETEHRLYSHFKVDVSPDGTSLIALIKGEAIDRGRHILDHEVKAVTHHAVSLEKQSEGWVAEVILDI